MFSNFAIILSIMLRAALNISWYSFVPNEALYGTLPRISDKAAWRRLGLAGHCVRHKELLDGELVLWKPSHGRRGRGRPSATFVDTLKRVEELTTRQSWNSACMTNQEDWRSRPAARLRPPWLIWLIDWYTNQWINFNSLFSLSRIYVLKKIINTRARRKLTIVSW